MEWNSSLYDEQHGFVAEYGKGLLEFVPEDAGQSILDVGCGTGSLTAQLADRAGRVVGVDSSPSMVERARRLHPDVDFAVCDALELPFEGEFDVVFSNAVFHWIGDHDALLRAVRRVLKPGGVLVCEFGASGNVETIDAAFERACAEAGFDYASKFNFPTVERFAGQLAANGFSADRVCAFDRPTTLKGGAGGLAAWMRQFYASELETMPERAREAAIERVEDLSREALWNGREWVADYRRLRAIARA